MNEKKAIEIIDIKELSSRIKISVKTIYRWVHYEYVPHIKMGGVVRFDWQDIISWIEKQKIRGNNKYGKAEKN